MNDDEFEELGEALGETISNSSEDNSKISIGKITLEFFYNVADDAQEFAATFDADGGDYFNHVMWLGMLEEGKRIVTQGEINADE